MNIKANNRSLTGEEVIELIAKGEFISSVTLQDQYVNESNEILGLTGFEVFDIKLIKLVPIPNLKDSTKKQYLTKVVTELLFVSPPNTSVDIMENLKYELGFIGVNITDYSTVLTPELIEKLNIYYSSLVDLKRSTCLGIIGDYIIVVV